MITGVTITGADNSIAPADLLPLQQEFPFVEWGILLSQSSQGHNRFPSFDWILTLAHFKENKGESLKLSGHLCGRWVREILLGTFDFVTDLTPKVFEIFDRVQINTHAEKHSANAYAFEKLAQLFPGKEFILQYDDVNTLLVTMAQQAGLKHAALFDLSHGAGVLPSQWPDLLPEAKCGYAGGLGPQNLKAQIERIEEKAGDTPVWIDMETHVFSDNGRQFDLDKVRKCLEIASPYVSQPA